MTKLLVVALVSIFAGFAQAEDQMDTDHPCHEVKMACEAAGFAKGQHKDGKGLWKDCMQKLSAGEAVPGVTVANEKIEACKTKRDEKKAEKKAERKSK